MSNPLYVSKSKASMVIVTNKQLVPTKENYKGEVIGLQNNSKFCLHRPRLWNPKLRNILASVRTLSVCGGGVSSKHTNTKNIWLPF